MFGHHVCSVSAQCDFSLVFPSSSLEFLLCARADSIKLEVVKLKPGLGKSAWELLLNSV